MFGVEDVWRQKLKEKSGLLVLIQCDYSSDLRI